MVSSVEGDARSNGRVRGFVRLNLSRVRSLLVDNRPATRCGAYASVIYHPFIISQMRDHEMGKPWLSFVAIFIRGADLKSRSESMAMCSFASNRNDVLRAFGRNLMMNPSLM